MKSVYLVFVESEDGYCDEVDSVFMNRDEADKHVDHININSDCMAYVEERNIADS